MDKTPVDTNRTVDKMDKTPEVLHAVASIDHGVPDPDRTLLRMVALIIARDLGPDRRVDTIVITTRDDDIPGPGTCTTMHARVILKP